MNEVLIDLKKIKAEILIAESVVKIQNQKEFKDFLIFLTSNTERLVERVISKISDEEREECNKELKLLSEVQERVRLSPKLDILKDRELELKKLYKELNNE